MWDLEKYQPICSFKNDPLEDPFYQEFSAVTKMYWINENTNPLLLTSTNDGILRIWKKFEDLNLPPKMISSWRAIFSGKGGRKRRAAMVSDWVQERGTLVL